MSFRVTAAALVAALALAPVTVAGDRSRHLRLRVAGFLAAAGKLTAMLKEKGWEVRNIKVDGGCYEVYALDDKQERVEAYFHPVTLERVKIAGE